MMMMRRNTRFSRTQWHLIMVCLSLVFSVFRFLSRERDYSCTISPLLVCLFLCLSSAFNISKLESKACPFVLFIAFHLYALKKKTSSCHAFEIELTLSLPQANYKIQAARLHYDIYALTQRLRHTTMRAEHEEQVKGALHPVINNLNNIYMFLTPIHLFLKLLAT